MAPFGWTCCIIFMRSSHYDFYLGNKHLIVERGDLERNCSLCRGTNHFYCIHLIVMLRILLIFIQTTKSLQQTRGYLCSDIHTISCPPTSASLSHLSLTLQPRPFPSHQLRPSGGNTQLPSLHHLGLEDHRITLLPHLRPERLPR